MYEFAGIVHFSSYAELDAWVDKRREIEAIKRKRARDNERYKTSVQRKKSGLAENELNTSKEST